MANIEIIIMIQTPCIWLSWLDINTGCHYWISWLDIIESYLSWLDSMTRHQDWTSWLDNMVGYHHEHILDAKSKQLFQSFSMILMFGAFPVFLRFRIINFFKFACWLSIFQVCLLILLWRKNNKSQHQNILLWTSFSKKRQTSKANNITSRVLEACPYLSI